MNTYKDISNKIEASIAESLTDLYRFAREQELPFLIVGAEARDIFFELLFNVRASRATIDTDVGIRVPTWEAFEKLETRMISSGVFKKDKKKPHRFSHRNGGSLDVIPFGELENPKGNIRWRENQSDMSTLGFDEALENAIQVKIAPDLVIPVSTPPSLVIMKLIAWDESYPHRNTDAKDVDFMLNQYINTGIEQRLYDGDRDITTFDDFDFGIVGPRMMGRDIAKIAREQTLQSVIKLLEKETDANSYCRLVRDMMQGQKEFDEEFAEKQALLKQLKLGVLDHQKKQVSP